MSDYTRENLPDVDKLFQKMEDGVYPNFLDIMAALSDIGDGSFPEPPACDGVRCQSCQ